MGAADQAMHSKNQKSTILSGKVESKKAYSNTYSVYFLKRVSIDPENQSWTPMLIPVFHTKEEEIDYEKGLDQEQSLEEHQHSGQGG